MSDAGSADDHAFLLDGESLSVFASPDLSESPGDTLAEVSYADAVAGEVLLVEVSLDTSGSLVAEGSPISFLEAQALGDRRTVSADEYLRENPDAALGGDEDRDAVGE